MNNPNDFSNLTGLFKEFIGNRELVFQILDLFPLPIEAFAPDGTSIFANRAMLEFFNVTDASLVVGKYNLKNDPICLEMFGRENIEKIFRGEPTSSLDFPVPIQNLADQNVIGEKPFEAATMDVYCLPAWDGGAFLFMICIFVVRNVYRGRTAIAKAKEYIDNNWLGEFDAGAAAGTANLSPSHLSALFRRNTGMTMNDYYKKTKVNHIKEKLKDKNLSVAEAFSFCGADSRGAFGKIFRKLTGMTPTEYRNSLKK